ncbi:MAG TPA: SoxR reducing system RseC family protein [Xanthomonadaceae bacterium]|nr:SoxR reducing system RseC family protein [Xanthomonadaceae bacterium]
MAERRAIVHSCSGSRVRLHASGACDECGGCGGRCNLFASGADDCIELDAAQFPVAPRPGDRVLLWLPDDWLRRAAWRAYGLLTLALVVGAGAGHALARMMGLDPDPATAIGALAGIALALPGRRVEPPQPRVRAQP